MSEAVGRGAVRLAAGRPLRRERGASALGDQRSLVLSNGVEHAVDQRALGAFELRQVDRHDLSAVSARQALDHGGDERVARQPIPFGDEQHPGAGVPHPLQRFEQPRPLVERSAAADPQILDHLDELRVLVPAPPFEVATLGSRREPLLLLTRADVADDDRRVARGTATGHASALA